MSGTGSSADHLLTVIFRGRVHQYETTYRMGRSLMRYYVRRMNALAVADRSLRMDLERARLDGSPFRLVEGRQWDGGVLVWESGTDASLTTV